MKIQYLGTAAAEGIPALFCECEICRKSRELGGKNIRTRSQALINDDLLVDFPPDTYMHYIQHGFDMTKVKNCIITHSHSDHLYVPDLEMRKVGFCSSPEKFEPLKFYSDKKSYNMVNDMIERYDIKKDEVEANLVEVNVPFNAGDYTVIPLRAAHDPKSDPVVYIIEKDGKRLFYSNDTSEYPEESWEFLRNYGKKLDLISLDCTGAWTDIEYIGHMGVKRCMALREKLIDMGLADENTIFVLNHFSHNGAGVVYDDFVKTAKEVGFLVSYDGMVIEF